MKQIHEGKVKAQSVGVDTCRLGHTDNTETQAKKPREQGNVPSV